MTLNRKHNLLTWIAGITGACSIALILTSCDRDARAKPNFVIKDGTKPGVVAKIGDQEITEDELIGEDKVEFFELKKREYELKMDRLNKVVFDKLVGAEAAKAKMPVEEFIEKKVTKGEIKVADKDVNGFIKERKLPEAQITPDIREKIKAYIQQSKKQEIVQAYVAKLTKGTAVEVYFKKPRMNVKVELGEAPTWGKEDAPVTIVEFSDFECPFCGRAADTINEVKKKFGEKKIKLAFKHFPLPMHPNAKPTSEASMCVNEQSKDKFWKFHDLAFKNREKLDAESLKGYAKQVGADVAKFEECFKSGKYKAFVEADLKQGEQVGVKSTPTFLINGEIISGAVPMSEFEDAVNEALEAAKK